MLSADPQFKVVVSSLENIIFNVAEMEFNDWSQVCFEQISARLQNCTDELRLISGLRALRSVFQAFEEEIDSGRATLYKLVDAFFPQLEAILQNQTLQGSSNYIPIMVLVCKIFFMTNHVSFLPNYFKGRSFNLLDAATKNCSLGVFL